jgi:hypothetical protein
LLGFAFPPKILKLINPAVSAFWDIFAAIFNPLKN